MRLAVLSDTHGLLRPEVLHAVAGADYILHAGDVGDPAILDALRAIAPLTAVRGNIDRTGPCSTLPATEALQLDGRLMYMLHTIADLDLNPRAAGMDLIVYGHSHQPLIERRDDVLFLNPGSCGPRRFRLPVTLAFVELEPGAINARIVDLAR